MWISFFIAPLHQLTVALGDIDANLNQTQVHTSISLTARKAAIAASLVVGRQPSNAPAATLRARRNAAGRTGFGSGRWSDAANVGVVGFHRCGAPPH